MAYLLCIVGRVSQLYRLITSLWGTEETHSRRGMGIFFMNTRIVTLLGLKPGILATKQGDYGMRNAFNDEPKLKLDQRVSVKTVHLSNLQKPNLPQGLPAQSFFQASPGEYK